MRLTLAFITLICVLSKFALVNVNALPTPATLAPPAKTRDITADGTCYSPCKEDKECSGICSSCIVSLFFFLDLISLRRKY